MHTMQNGETITNQNKPYLLTMDAEHIALAQAMRDVIPTRGMILNFATKSRSQKITTMACQAPSDWLLFRE